ncbi:uncharacterized protein TNCT_410961 [Trichonephila clavata]|uniref:Uncharacterized protein n=1 Tax=Trichonephila clavata TaxID=2740835 RepID=A0A8X6LCK5_TRICU|nr:uncharacterized protein TNCT_410961 [Trichonephila clavata]
MIFGDPVMPTLQEMSIVEVAVRICNDPETMAFMKKYGPVSFIFPSNELLAFINKEIPESSLQMKLSLLMTEEKCVLTAKDPNIVGCISISESYNDFCFNTNRFTANNLPSTMWEEMVFRKISYLGLPNILGYKLVSIIRCTCLEIYRWHIEHKKERCEFEILDIQKYFYWNAKGKINRIKTAKSLINNESLSVSARYNLARLYGFERDVISLWEKKSTDEKDYAKQLGDHYRHRTWFEYGATGAVENLFHIFLYPVVTPLNFRVFLSLLTPTLKVEWCKILINLKVMDNEDICSCLSVLQKHEQENILREYSSKIYNILGVPLQKGILKCYEKCLALYVNRNYIKI